MSGRCPADHPPTMRYQRWCKPTLLEVVEVPELHQGVPIVVIGDVDPLLPGQGILHPGSLVAPVGVLGGGPRDGGQRVLAAPCVGRERLLRPEAGWPHCPLRDQPPPAPCSPSRSPRHFGPGAAGQARPHRHLPPASAMPLLQLRLLPGSVVVWFCSAQPSPAPKGGRKLE